MGLPDRFVDKYGSQDELCNDNGLAVKNIYNLAKNTLGI